MRFMNAHKIPHFKARLHLLFLLRFLVRFSPSDACERVDELGMFGVQCTLCTFI